MKDRKTIQLTDRQRERLEGLWFIYGNGRRKHTMGNHKFIQGFLERGMDLRKLYKPTDECMAAVDAVIAHKKESCGPT